MLLRKTVYMVMINIHVSELYCLKTGFNIKCTNEFKITVDDYFEQNVFF